jgi:hypothetical protein
MNRLLFFLLLFVIAILFALAVRAQPSNPPPSVTLQWNPSQDPTPANVAGYWIWQGTAHSNYARSFFVPGRLTTNTVVTNIVRGQTYFWNISVLGTNGAAGLESDLDGEATTNVPAPPLPATGLRIISAP